MVACMFSHQFSFVVTSEPGRAESNVLILVVVIYKGDWFRITLHKAELIVINISIQK